MVHPALTLWVIAIGLEVVSAAEPQAWNPEAADLLFASGRDGNSEIYLLRAGQQDWINLSNHEATDNWPVWSPDGTRIVFQSNRSGNLDLWVMAADGSRLVQLTRHAEPDYLPSWSPDGRTILFTSWRTASRSEQRAPHLHTMSADGSNQRRIVRKSLNSSEGGTWSADGRSIVYSRRGGKGADIHIAARDGGRERRITRDQDRDIYNGSPVLSPDGRRIAFYSDSGATAALVVVDVDGGNRRTLIAEGHNWYPRWSPDGRWLVYTATVIGGEKGDIDLFAIPVEGGRAPVRLVSSPKREQEGSWRPGQHAPAR